MAKKFKVTEKDAEIKRKSRKDSVGDIEWEGETLQAESKTKLEEDLGTGQKVVIRFFEFGANPLAFKDYKPTEQQLFDHHRKGIESLLWRDELQPYQEIAPRIMFSKNKTHYRIIITCIPRGLGGIVQDTQTLSQLIKK